jgi:hypothetical protein
MSVTETVIIRPLIKSTSTFLHLAAIHSVTIIESKLSRSKDVQRRVTVQHGPSQQERRHHHWAFFQRLLGIWVLFRHCSALLYKPACPAPIPAP